MPGDRKGFDLGDYVEVKERIRLFYEAYPTGAICTDSAWVSVDDDTPRVWVRAYAYRSPDDPHPGVGNSWMVLPGATPYTKGSELENVETSAWGRAIGATGIGISGGIASANEVQAKQGESTRPTRPPLERTTHENGLVGKVATSGTQDFELRETPDGWVLPFRLKEGNRAGQIVIAHGQLAKDLYAHREAVIGQRATVWGRYTDEETTKPDGFVVSFKVLHVERFAGPDFILPLPASDSPVTPSDGPGAAEARPEAESSALFPDDDLSDVPGYQ